MFAALEGLQGVGKSTIYRLLQQQLGSPWTTVPSISKEINDARKVVDSTGNVDARYLFYLSQVILSGKTVDGLIKNGKNVLVESYIFRTITYHEGVGSKLNFNVEQFDILMPDKIFYLKCGDTERIHRINSRNKRIGYWNELAETYKSQIEFNYSKLMDQMIVIDTTNIDPETTVQKIISLI
jgi:dTMP kinase